MTSARTAKVGIQPSLVNFGLSLGSVEVLSSVPNIQMAGKCHLLDFGYYRDMDVLELEHGSRTRG
jgi:hypothetical protein